MKTYIYIISEYNPPHGGHKYMIEHLRSRFPDAIVTAIMSGNFVERGSPAIVNKYCRAHAALNIGADLVLSLPFPFCMGSAEFFARAGVTIANALSEAHPDDRHILAFGSESGDTDAIILTGQRIAECSFRDELYRRGAEYHTARGITMLYTELYGKDASLPLQSPNDTLGIEYVRAITESGSSLIPVTVRRVGADHDSNDSDGGAVYPSASTVRQRIYSCGKDGLSLLPDDVGDIIGKDLDKYGPANENNYGDAILSMLRMLTSDKIGEYAECGGGVGERLIASANRATSYSDMLALAATKQYTNARLRRASVYAYLGVIRRDISAMPKYTQLLAANRRGTEALHGMVRKAGIPILTKRADYDKMPPDAARQYELDAKADKLYTLAYSPHLPTDAFMRISPIIIT